LAAVTRFGRVSHFLTESIASPHCVLCAARTCHRSTHSWRDQSSPQWRAYRVRRIAGGWRQRDGRVERVAGAPLFRSELNVVDEDAACPPETKPEYDGQVRHRRGQIGALRVDPLIGAGLREWLTAEHHGSAVRQEHVRAVLGILGEMPSSRGQEVKVE